MDHQDVELPSGSKILSVQAQNGLPQIWAMVDDSQVKTDMVHIRMCSRLGNSQTPLCDSLIKENDDCDYQGGHFILKQ